MLGVGVGGSSYVIHIYTCIYIYIYAYSIGEVSYAERTRRLLVASIKKVTI